jgi:uncharacterized protein YndB with AHSA1/START domain
MQRLLAPLCMFVISLAQIAHASERAINASITVNAPIADVWDAWSTQQGVKSFFAPDAVVDLKVGGLYEMHMNPYAVKGEKGGDDMRIMAVQAPTMLSFTWNAPPHLSEARKQRTLVVVRLAQAGEKQTNVALHHTGWGVGGEWDKTYEYFSRAWPGVLANLKKRFDEGPMDWAPWLARMKAASEKAEAAKAANPR